MIDCEPAAFGFLQTLYWDRGCTPGEHADLLHYVWKALMMHSDIAELHGMGLGVLVTR